MIYTIETTAEFNTWFNNQDDKTKGAIRARFSRIQQAGHFGIVKSVGDGVFEFKWKNGLRVYFGYLERTRFIRRQ